MALINCPECGKEISDKATSCPNCGFPVGFESASINSSNNNQYQIQTAQKVENFKEDNHSINTVQSTIKPSKNNVEQSKKSIIEFICFIAMFIVIGAIINHINKEPDNLSVGNNITAEDSNNNPSPELVTKTEPATTAVRKTYEDVFFYTLMDNTNQYNGKSVRTVIKVYRCYQYEEESYIRSQYSDSSIVENSSDIKIYPDNYQDFEYGEYVTVEGILGKDGSEDILTNAHIVDYGANSQNTFERDLSICVAEHNQKLQQEKETFIESCVSVSYDELRKYPDSYKDVPIKLTIYAEDVEPDGWIFPGDIIATINGEELAVYDDRIVREPRIIEGDTVTIYAIGDGLATMKVKQKGLVFNKTIDEYDVPAVKIKYTENDKDFVED